MSERRSPLQIEEAALNDQVDSLFPRGRAVRAIEVNKILGAILVAALALRGAGVVADKLFQQEELIHAGAQIAPAPAETQSEQLNSEAPVATTKTGTATTDQAARGSGLATLLQTADPAAGKQVAKRCAACHDFTKGGPNKIGPNLYDIVDAKPAHAMQFAYSDAIKGLTSEWNYEALDAFLAAPKEYAPGTKMSFPGLRKAEDRAAVIVFLRQLSDSPRPLSEAPTAADPAVITPGEPLAPAGDAAAAPTEPTASNADAAAKTEALSAVPPDTAAAAGDANATAVATEAPAVISAPVGANTTESGGTQVAATTPAALFPPLPEAQSLAGWLSIANLERGARISRQCAICHSFDAGGPVKIGPPLWNIIGAKKASQAGFVYTEALRAIGGEWSYEDLDKFLTAPGSYAPGSKMTFPGMARPADRAAVILWLRTRGDAAPLLPEVPAAEAKRLAVTATARPTVPPTPIVAVDTTARAVVQRESAAAPAAAESQTPLTAQTAETAAVVPPDTDQSTTEAAAPASASLADLLRSADPSAGEKLAKKCAACHSFDKGGPKKVGPNLWNIVGAKQAAREDFAYSDALKALGKEWTFGELDQFLMSPKTYAAGTKMSFPGLKTVEERAALIVWLRTLSDSPAALP
ncbi:MAG: c-type cytochrome [Dongiaceae bacterium]